MSGSEFYSHPGVLLKDHLLAVAEGASENAVSVPLTGDWLDRGALARLVYIVGVGHDLGKATGYFQRYLSSGEGEKAKLKADPRTHHALISAFLVAEWLRRTLEGQELAGLHKDMIVAMAFEAVRRHHGGLRKLYDDLAPPLPREERVLWEQWQCIAAGPFAELLNAIGYPGKREEFGELLGSPAALSRSLGRTIRRYVLSDQETTSSLGAFFLMELVFSLLLDADKKHAAGVPLRLSRGTLDSEAVDRYRADAGWLEPGDQLSRLRNRLYDGVNEQVELVEAPGLMTLTAPTGSGKTVVALSCALRLREKLATERGTAPRIIYALPFLSIIDQTVQVFKTVLGNPGSDELLAHHHLSDVLYRTREDEFDPDVAELLVEGWESEVVVTTFVQLFHTLIGHRNRPLRRFWRLAGAIIILDEVQCLPHRYWLLFRQAAQVFSRRFGTTFILMTATQPAIFDSGISRELVKDSRGLFLALDRVDFSVDIEQEMSLEHLASEVHRDMCEYPDRDVLVVLNTVRSARKFYGLVRQLGPDAGEYFFLSSQVVPKQRLDRIHAAKACQQRKIIVSTQVVEAGVDLDCDLVYRDFAPLDSLVQVAGRCNRHGRKPWRGQVRVVRLIDETAGGREYCRYVYDPFLLDCTRRALAEGGERLREVEFLEVVRHYYRFVEEGLSDESSREVLRAMAELDFDGGEHSVSDFRLINERNQADVFVELDDEAQLVWARYLELSRARDLAERRRGFAQIKAAFSRYVISVDRHTLEKKPPPVMGHLGYVPNGQLDSFYDPNTGWNPMDVIAEIW